MAVAALKAEFCVLTVLSKNMSEKIQHFFRLFRRVASIQTFTRN